MSTNLRDDGGFAWTMEERDILAPVVEEIVTEQQMQINPPPRDLSRDWAVASAVGAGTVLGVLGAMMGSHMGIALMGTAIAGTWPLAAVGILLGGLAGHAIGRKIPRE